MQARMNNPVMIIPGAMQPALALVAAVKNGSVPMRILELSHLRASQINGCSFCVDMGARELKKVGETDERLFAVSAWREAPYFTDAERAVLELTEAATRLSDRGDAVPDQIWKEAARYYDEKQLATIILNIALTNFWNRLNATVRQVAGELPKSADAKQWAAESHARVQELVEK
jgi:AhpD family alkylhydroperoxidase